MRIRSGNSNDMYCPINIQQLYLVHYNNNRDDFNYLTQSSSNQDGKSSGSIAPL